MTTPEWDEFVAWSRVVVASGVDLDATEHGYKREVARRVGDVRELFLTGDEGWASKLPDALAKRSNLLHHFTVMHLRAAAEADPTALGAAVATLWTPETVDERDLANFDKKVRHVWPQITPGNVVAIGALLLMARDPERFPPYRATFVKEWAGLVGFPLDEGTPVSRYSALLAMCDELIGSAGDLGIATRLEAQGLAWAVLKTPDKELDLDATERAEFRRWRHGGDVDAADQGQRAWLMRPKPGGAELLARWLDDGFVSLRAEHLGILSPGASRAEVGSSVDSSYQHLDYAQRATLAGEYHAFLSRMAEGDVLATVVEGQMRVGVVTGPPTYEEDPSARLQREVEWSDVVLPRDDVPAPLSGMLDHQGVVVDITAAADVFDALLRVPSPDPTTTDTLPEQVRDVIPSLPRVTEQVAARLFTDRSALQSIADLLQTRQQIVLYGPPGTGKTFVALELAKHFVGDDSSRAQLVQFHPSYAYEDFFEGYRPAVQHGQATFVLKPGPLRLLAQEASKPENRGTPYVLVIDEMNRGNLAKVFGELYFLLEYRDRSVQLQYSPGEPFQLPKNLFIIGTMNTADRSITMVDAAIRRRFAFVEMHPSEPPVSTVLARYVEANRIEDDRAEVLAALNEEIGQEGRDLQIGPSYFMRADVDTEGGMERVFTYDLLPLLEEHYYGTLDRDQLTGRFGVEALRRRLDKSREPAESEEA